MKNSRFVVALAGCILFMATVRAEDYVRYKASPLGSSVHLDGSANIHDWTMDGTIIGGWLDLPAGVVLDSAQAAVGGAADGKIAAHAEVGIPVTSIKNVTWEGMNEVMQATMNATNFPRIVYKLSEMTLKQPHTAGTPFQFDTTGELAINGVTNKISMPVSIETVDKSQLKIIATKIPVNMTDYKVQPPVTAGVFTTKPEVKITFTWIVKLLAKPAESK